MEPELAFDIHMLSVRELPKVVHDTVTDAARSVVASSEGHLEWIGARPA